MDLTWPCHVCKEERPDEKISVLQKSKIVFGTRVTQNVRFCNDKNECIEGAREIDFLKNVECKNGKQNNG